MPTLSIDVEARIAQATDAITKLERTVKGSFSSMQKAASLLGATLGVGAFTVFIKRAIDAQDALNDLSKSTGVAATTLGGLGFAAKQSGSDLEGVAQAVGKLNLNIAKAAAGNDEAAQGFKALGLSVRNANGQIKSGDQVLLEIADKFAKFRDGPNKAALGMALFGKAYQSILPLLAEGGQRIADNVRYWKEFSGVTEDSVTRADELNDQLEKVNLHFSAVGTVLANAVVPSLLAVAEAMTNLQENSGLLVTMAKGFAELFKTITVLGANVAYVFTQIGEEAAGLALQLKALATLDFDTFTALRDEMVARAEENRKAIDEFSERVMNPPKAPPVAAKPAAMAEAPGLVDTSKILAQEKALVEQRLHAMQAWIAEESDLLKARNEANEAYYQEGYLGANRFFDLQDAAQQEALENQRRAFEESENLLRDYIAFLQKTGDQKALIEAQTKLNDLLAKQAKLEADVAREGTKSYFARAKAVQQQSDAITELNAALDEGAGRTAEAAAARRTIQNRQFRLQLESSSPGNVAQLDELERRQAAQDKLNEKLTESGRTFAELGRTEREIQDKLIEGQITYTEALEKTDAARRAQIPLIEDQLTKARAAALSTGSPEAFERVKELEQSLRDLEATSNQVGERMRGIFQDAFIDPFEDLVKGVKSADDALKDFFKNIASALLRIQAQNIAQTIFGGGLFGLFGAAGAGGTAPLSGRMALGGIMTSDGPLSLQKYRGGGIASRPQLALFGEGRQPEAYVPLPDGRSIPVTMRGFDSSQWGEPTLEQSKRGPKTQVAQAPTVNLAIHPDAINMTLRDWLEGEMARTMATR